MKAMFSALWLAGPGAPVELACAGPGAPVELGWRGWRLDVGIMDDAAAFTPATNITLCSATQPRADDKE